MRKIMIWVLQERINFSHEFIKLHVCRNTGGSLGDLEKVRENEFAGGYLHSLTQLSRVFSNGKKSFS